MSSLYKSMVTDLPDYVREMLITGIPKLSSLELMELYSQIKPLITIDGEKYLIDNLSREDLISLSYLSLSKNNVGEVIDNCRKVTISDLKEMRDFVCLHKFGFSLQFRPSVNEILSQIPQDLIHQVDAFEIVESPVLPNDLYRYPLVSNKRYHMSRVMTYKIK